MSYWNYRVVRTDLESGSRFEIHSVYYDDRGRIKGWSASPVSPSGESAEWLTKDLEHMREALERPILKETKVADDRTELINA